MVSVPASEDSIHPSKRRKKATRAAETVPTWESTRFFEQPKPKPVSSLPTIEPDGNICRAPSKAGVSRPSFVLKAPTSTKTKSASAAVEQQNLNAQNRKFSASRSSLSNTPGPSSSGLPRRPSSLMASAQASKKRQRHRLESYAQKLKSMEDARGEIASLASAILANPQRNVAKLKRLRQMATQYRGRIASFVILTEAQLYKDIAPAYRIRPITEKEADIKVSQDIAQLRNFEQAFLSSYQRFVRSCISHSRWRASGNVSTPAAKDMSDVRRSACKSLAELLRALPHFNEADSLVSNVCGLAVDREPQVRELVCEALTELLSNAHRASGHTLQTSVAIAKKLCSVASGKARIIPEEVVTPLSEIHFAGFAKLPISRKGANDKKKPKRFNKKHHAKDKKQGDSAGEDATLERDLAEGDADATPQEMYAARKSLLDAVCNTCFNVVKAAAADEVDMKKGQKNAPKSATKLRTKKPPPALSAALRGLLRVSRFVNADIIEAIIATLTPMLHATRYPLAIRFRCLSVAYAILGLHARSQQTDPDSFTSDSRAMDGSLYSMIGELYGFETRDLDAENITFDALEAVVSAHAYRHIPAPRAAALARRLCVQSAGGATTHACTIGLMKAGQMFLDSSLVAPIYEQKKRGSGRADKGSDAAFGESGLLEEYNMKTDDPDIASAQRSAAWELSCLVHHFHPSVRDLAESCAGGFCGAKLPKTTENIVLSAKAHVSKEGGFNPAPQAELPSNVPNKRKRWVKDCSEDGALALVYKDAECRRHFLVGDEDSGSFFETAWCATDNDVTCSE